MILAVMPFVIVNLSYIGMRYGVAMKQIKIDKRFKLLGLTILACLGLPSASTAGGVGYTPPEVHITVSKGISTNTAKVVQNNTKLTADVVSSVERDTQMILDALRVLTKQSSVSGQEMAMSDLKAKIHASSIAQGIENANLLTKVSLDYGTNTGQGYNVCYVLSDALKTKSATDNAKIKALTEANKTDNVGGRLEKNSHNAFRKRTDEHRENYCTASDVQAGLCNKESPLAGADLSISSLMTSASKDDGMDKAKVAFRQNLLGQSDKAVPKSAGGTDVAHAYLLQTMQRQARLAPASYTLAYHHAMSTKDPNLLDSQGNPMSPDEKVEATVNRYYGTDESKEWLKSLIAQRPRGLLVEQAKMAGVESYLHLDNLQSKERQLMMLASLTATTYEKMDIDMQKQYSTMVKR